jgi:hypothetical protein
MRHYAYGRRPPAPRGETAMRASLLMSGALDALGPAAPDGIDYISAVAGRFGSYGNENIADCCPVDTANALILRTANASQAVIPTLPQVTALYSAVGGYVQGDASTDNGCSESDMGAYLLSTGFLGHKATAVGPVDYTDINRLQWAQRLFGTCRLGWNLPGYAEDLFDAGLPWDVQTTGDQSTEGHDTALVDYRGGLLYVVSWYDSATAYVRKLVPVTPAFALKYLEESSVELFGDWIRAQGTAPSGFDLGDLTAKLSAVAS